MNIYKNISEMTLSEIYTATCIIIQAMKMVERAGLSPNGTMVRRLQELRAENDRRTCLPMLTN